MPALRGSFQWRARTPAAIAPWNLSAPTLTGTAAAGVGLQTSPGTWSVAGAPLSYGYQWLSCDAAGAGCAAISSATGSTYTPGAQDVGRALRVTVTATNAGGPSEPRTSAATVPVAAAAVPPPSDTGTPPATGSTPAAPVASAPPTTTPAAPTTAPPAPTTAPATPTATPAPAARTGVSGSATTTTSPATAGAPLTETISVAGHQSARTVAATGLAVTVSCSQACTASITVRGTGTARTADATARVSILAGVRKTLRMRVHGGAAKRLTLTSSAQQTAAPHGVARPLTRHLSLS